MTLETFRRRLLVWALLFVTLFFALFSSWRWLEARRTMEDDLLLRIGRINDAVIERLSAHARLLVDQSRSEPGQRLFPGFSRAYLPVLVVTDERGRIVESLRGPLVEGLVLPPRFLSLEATVTSLLSSAGWPLVVLSRPLLEGGWLVAGFSPQRLFQSFDLLREGEWALILSSTGRVLLPLGDAEIFPFGALLPSRLLAEGGGVRFWLGQRQRFLSRSLKAENLILVVGYPTSRVWFEALRRGLAAGAVLALGCLVMLGLLFPPFASVLKDLSRSSAVLAQARQALLSAESPIQALPLLRELGLGEPVSSRFAEFRSIDGAFSALIRTVADQGEELVSLYEEATAIDEELSDANRRLSEVMRSLNTLLVLAASSQRAGSLDDAAAALAEGICQAFESPFCAFVIIEGGQSHIWSHYGSEELLRAFRILSEGGGRWKGPSIGDLCGLKIHCFPVRTLNHHVGDVVVALPEGRDTEALYGVMEPLVPHLAGLLHSREMLAEVKEAYHDVSIRMQVFTQAYHEETGAHLARIGDYAVLFGSELGLSEDCLSDLRAFSQLHDVGKLKVPEALLSKPSALTAEEFAVVKRHTLWGAEILGDSPWFAMARDICLGHHERWCGGGYPRGLSGEAIPLAARIVSLCDVYDALRSRRSYKLPFSHERALRIILEGDGRVEPDHFDPRLLEILRRRGDELARLFESRPDEAPQE